MPSNLDRTPTSEVLNLQDIVHFLSVHRKLVLFGAILGIIAGLIATLGSPTLYTATATVELNKDSNSGLGIEDLSGSSNSISSGAQFQTELLTHQNVLLNASTAISVIDSLHLTAQHPYSDAPRGTVGIRRADTGSLSLAQAASTRDRALAIFRAGLRVDLVKNTTLLKVSFTDTEPDRAARIANAVVQAYLANHTEARFTATSSASQWLTAQLDSLKRKVEDNHRKVAEFQRSKGVVATGLPVGKGTGGTYSAEQDPNSTAIQRLLALNAALSKAEVTRIEAEAAYRLTQTESPDIVLQASATSLAQNPDNPAAAIGGRNVQLLEALRAEAAQLRVQRAAAQNKYGARFPEVTSLQAQLATVQDQIRQELKRIDREARANFLLARADEATIRKSVDAQQQAVFSLGDSLTALTFLEQEESTSRGLYQDLYTRLEEANIAAGVKSTDMVIVDPALRPSQSSSPSLRVDLLGGLAAGAFAGIVVGLLRQLWDTSLHSPGEFAEVWDIALLGTIPRFDPYRRPFRRLKIRIGDRLLSPDPLPQRTPEAWVYNAAKSRTAEAYRQIRTSILLSNLDAPTQVLLVTSALSGDGKSTTAYHLAVVFALQAKRVLLLDADLRCSTIRERSGCLGEVGLSDLLLAEDTPLERAIQQHPRVPTLSVIVAGTAPPMPAELLGSQRFAHLVTLLRERYDYIVIDAPPVLDVTDPLLIASSVDGIAVVVRSGVTTRNVVRAVAAELTRPNLHVIGCIVNAVESNSQRYAYGLGY